MELTEDQIIQRCTKNCGHSNRNNLFPYGYVFTCFSCGYIVIKRKHDLSKIQRKKIKYVNRLKYAELTSFCICVMYIKLMKVMIIIKCTKIYQQ